MWSDGWKILLSNRLLFFYEVSLHIFYNTLRRYWSLKNISNFTKTFATFILLYFSFIFYLLIIRKRVLQQLYSWNEAPSVTISLAKKKFLPIICWSTVTFVKVYTCKSDLPVAHKLKLCATSSDILNELLKANILSIKCTFLSALVVHTTMRSVWKNFLSLV